MKNITSQRGFLLWFGNYEVLFKTKNVPLRNSTPAGGSQ